MAIPSDPSIATVVTEGLRRGGIINPTSDQITTATDNAFREVKADIALIAPDHPLLRATSLQPCTLGQSRYSWPTDARSIIAVYVLDAPDDMRGTAQAGASTTITLASTFSKETTEVRGKLIMILGGTGSGQYRQVVNYNDTTKVATVDTAWTTNPSSDTTYGVATVNRRLWPIEEGDFWQHGSIWYWSSASWIPTAPTTAMLHAREIWLDRPPDRQYGLVINYYTDLDRIDEAGTVFLRCLRDWRSLWVYGVAVKSMEHYDIDKASLKHGAKFPNLTQLQNTYQALLSSLSGQAGSIVQTVYNNL